VKRRPRIGRGEKLSVSEIPLKAGVKGG